MPIVYKSPITGWRVANPKDEKSFVNSLLEKAIPHKIVKHVPTIKSLEKWSEDGVCLTPDGCRVEPDGSCEHGFPSWLQLLGFI